MKILLFISFILFAANSFAQISINSSKQSNDTTMKYFLVGDRVISCSNCTVDFCGNITNINGDTIATNSRPMNSDEIPLYFTKDNILLTQRIVKKLDDRKKIRSITVFKCNEGRKIFGDLAKNGLILLELQDTTIKTENLLDYLNRKHADKNILVTDVLINGLQTTDKSIKYPKWDKLILDFDTRKNIYNIKTE